MYCRDKDLQLEIHEDVMETLDLAHHGPRSTESPEQTILQLYISIALSPVFVS